MAHIESVIVPRGEIHFLSLFLKLLPCHQKHLCGSLLTANNTHMKLLPRLALDDMVVDLGYANKLSNKQGPTVVNEDSIVGLGIQEAWWGELHLDPSGPSVAMQNVASFAKQLEAYSRLHIFAWPTNWRMLKCKEIISEAFNDFTTIWVLNVHIQSLEENLGPFLEQVCRIYLIS